jgi:hypothetical protein
MKLPSNPHAIFEIDGFRWDSWEHPDLFQKVGVELATGEASMATWSCVDASFRVIDKYAGIAAGTGNLPVIRAWLGYGHDLGEPVFKGLLARVERGEATTTFRAYDMSYKMRLVEKAQYQKGTDLQLIEKTVKRNDLQFQPPSKPLKLEPHQAFMQDFKTDWAFVSEVAHDAGMLVWTRQDTVFADYPAQVGEPKLVLTYGKDFSILRNFDLAFKVPENKSGRPKGVEVRGRGRGGKRLSGKSDEAQRGHQVLLAKKDLPMHTKQRATARARAQKELDREHAFSISISQLFASAPALRPDVRDTIQVLQVGRLFSGDYLADKVTHEFSAGKLSTAYELYRDVKE